jgi:hypothetical protein
MKCGSHLGLMFGGGLVLVGLISLRLGYEFEKAYRQLTPGVNKDDVVIRTGFPNLRIESENELSRDAEPRAGKCTQCIEEFSYYSQLRVGL